MNNKLAQIRNDLSELLDVVNQVLTNINERLDEKLLVKLNKKPEETAPIDFLPDIYNLLYNIDAPWTASLAQLSDYALIKIKSVNRNDIIYEKGAKRYMAKMKRKVTPLFDFFEVDEFYIVRYNLRERWGIEWARRLDIPSEEFVKLNRQLAARVMHLKAELL